MSEDDSAANFLLLLADRLADRVGWRPLPVEIPVIEFEAIREHLRVDDPKGCRRLVEWYRRDDNAVPPVYLLRSRTGSFARSERWTPIEDSLRTALTRGISTLSLSRDARLKYVASGTELEARAGGLRESGGDRRGAWAMCFFRSLTAAADDAGAVTPDRGPDRGARGRFLAVKRMARSVVPAVAEYEATSAAGRITRGHIPSFRSEAYLAIDERLESTGFLVHDRDAKFCGPFDAIVRAEGVRVIETPLQAPKANAIAERWVRTVRHDCLDHLLIVGRRQLEQVLRVYLTHYG